LALEAHQRLTIRKGSKPSPFSSTGGCTWETTIDPAYEDWAKAQARIQLAKAGFRLAALFKAIFAPRRRREAAGLLAGGMSALIGVDDLAAGGKPHGIALLHLGDRALQIFDAQRLAGDHGMERNAHDSRLLLAVGQQRLELIDHGTV